MVASLIGAGISALGSIGGALASNAMSLGQQKDIADYQAALNYKYAKKSALNMPTFNRQGLEKANFNPMLAISSGLSNANSSWSSGGSATTSDMSGAVNNALNTALSVREQENQNKLADSQVGLNNANSVLSQNRALTETYTQLEKMAHTDLMEADKVLRDKQATYQEKVNAWYDKKASMVIERMNTQNKVDIMNAFSNQVTSNAQMVNAGANSRDVDSKVEQRRYQNNGYDLDNLYKGMWLDPNFKPNFYNYGINGMQKHPYK